MELNYEKLQKHLYELIEVRGVNAAQVTKESKVWNIKKIMDGLSEPMLSSWAKLHRAFPKDIPPPEYKSGETVYIQADNQSQAAGRDIRHATITKGEILTAEEQAVVNALRSIEDKAVAARIARKLLGMIDDLVDQICKN